MRSYIDCTSPASTRQAHNYLFPRHRANPLQLMKPPTPQPTPPPKGVPMFELIGVELFETDGPVQHISRYLKSVRCVVCVMYACAR